MKGRRPCEDRERLRATIKIARNHQKPELVRKSSSLESSKGAWHHQHLDFRVLASRTVKESIFIILSHPVWYHFFQQPQGTNTDFGTKKKCCNKYLRMWK